MITLITACSKNRVIGKDNELIWHLPEDLKRFKKLTTNKVVVMGRKTYESIGRPLPNRTNIILTRKKDFKPTGCIVYNNINDVLSIFDKSDVWVIGGGQVYKQFLKHANKIELTFLDKEFDGDSFFPILNKDDWEITNLEERSSDDLDFKYITYERK